MQITLVQREIEEALRNFVSEMVTVPEGHEIAIQFRATRGSDGYQANVVIHPAGEAPTTPEKKSRSTTSSSSTSVVAPKRRGRPPKAKPTEEATETLAAPAATLTASSGPVGEDEQARIINEAENTAEVASDEVASDTAAETTAETAQEEPHSLAQEIEPAPVVQQRPSIFGGLNKPQNTPESTNA